MARVLFGTVVPCSDCGCYQTATTAAACQCHRICSSFWGWRGCSTSVCGWSHRPG
ncbi:hypothetical protein DH86_00002914 [Scytalidium sp. 3C]|nr:hypothetical protein DH86_00002914 [Scytalidium sp. 3C]